jgi:hypothetical protein
MDAFDYLRFVIQNLSCILYNTSQSDTEWNSKDSILNNIKRIIQEYNDKVSDTNKVDYTDFRKNG